MIQFKDVSLYYDQAPVLSKINLEITPGRVTGILGPNGCGKSTLLSSVQKAVRYTGQILLMNKEVREYSSPELARVIAAVPQMHHPSFPYTAEEVVLSGRAPFVTYLPKKEDREKAADCLSQVNALYLAKRPYTKISGGERQLVLLARALCQEPKVILFDEPTSALDFRNTYSTMRLIKKLSIDQGITCLITIHDPNLALSFCDEIILFKKNNLVQGGPGELITQEMIKEVYDMETFIFCREDIQFVVPRN